MSRSTLAQRLVAARTEAGLTQGDVAAAVGFTQPSYAALESGRSQSTSKIGSLAHLLRVRALWLETGEGAMRFDGVAEQPIMLTDDEQEVLRLFRKMKPEQRRGLLEFLTKR